MGAFRRRSTVGDSSTTSSNKNNGNRRKKTSAGNARRICFPDDDANLFTIVCEIPCRQEYTEQDLSESRGDSSVLRNSFSEKSKSIQEQLNVWTTTSAQHDCRGLERWSNREHGDQRSQEQFSAIMAILQAQQDMINANIMRSNKQRHSTRRSSINSTASRSTVASTASTTSQAIDYDSLRKVAIKVTRSARHFARMMGKADSHAVATELKADPEFQRQFSSIWNNNNNNNNIDKESSAQPPNDGVEEKINETETDAAAAAAETTTTTTTTNSSPPISLGAHFTSSSRNNNSNNLNQIMMNRSEDDVSLTSEVSSVVESEISNTDIARLSSGVSILSMDSEYEFEQGGDENDLLFSGTSTASTGSILLSNSQDEDDDEEEDFLPQVDECQEASRKAKKSKSKKLRLLKKLKRRINTKSGASSTRENGDSSPGGAETVSTAVSSTESNSSAGKTS
eukprot:CAMPEP_0168863766 /NCGR_PEP_ID=MMETSP0727-20121128/19116_1 /TAXON_ID=265536 /ORGANISM="Amphiprora sp., Strain CCMP467" /LENGTH=453 /DNA_ID=CAMNT_0008918839 /DNA_START=133 /DNA_END=1490 /DNA_ORIENTATION=+